MSLTYDIFFPSCVSEMEVFYAMTEGTTEVSTGLHDVCVTTASDISMHIESIFLLQKCVTDIFIAVTVKCFSVNLFSYEVCPFICPRAVVIFIANADLRARTLFYFLTHLKFSNE